MKLTVGVNFINVFLRGFLYKSYVLAAFSSQKSTCVRKKRTKMLMKLTVGCHSNNTWHFFFGEGVNIVSQKLFLLLNHCFFYSFRINKSCLTLTARLGFWRYFFTCSFNMSRHTSLKTAILNSKMSRGLGGGSEKCPKMSRICS